MEFTTIKRLACDYRNTNRLWFYDEHTSRLPLFHWLPNELAFYYSKMSKRENFRELYHDYFPETKQHFLRRGRGMSFHEIDLAIAPVSTLNVISSLEEFGKYPRGTSALGSEFKAIMQRIVPDIHTGFFDEHLDHTISPTCLLRPACEP